MDAGEEARAALYRRQRANRKHNNERIARADSPSSVGRDRVMDAWNPMALVLAEIGRTEPEDYDSERGNYAGEQR